MSFAGCISRELHQQVESLSANKHQDIDALAAKLLEMGLAPIHRGGEAQAFETGSSPILTTVQLDGKSKGKGVSGALSSALKKHRGLAMRVGRLTISGNGEQSQNGK
jgi:hypothetical protein